MKLVSKSTISKFSTEQLSVSSAIDLFGKQPHHMAGYVRSRTLAKQLGLMYITEALNGVYSDEKNFSKLKEIDTWQFTWDVEVEQVPTIRFTRSYTGTPASTATGRSFVVYVDSKYLNAGDIFALRNGQLLYVVTRPEQLSDSEWKCVVALKDKAQATVDIRYLAQNETVRYVTNNQSEYSEFAAVKYHYNTERHTNFLTKIRADMTYTSDFKAIEDKYFMTDEDAERAIKDNFKGRYKVFKFSSVEQMVVDHFLVSANNAMLLDYSSIDPETGRCLIQDAKGQDVISGDGLIPQYERYAHYIDFNTLRLKTLQRAIEYVCDKRGQSQGNHITVLCNRRFSRLKASALEDAINVMIPNNNGTWFFSRDMKDVYGTKDAYGLDKKLKMKKTLPNEINVGATFNSYVYEGNVVTFIVDEALTRHYRDRAYAIFIDTGIYEDERGQVPSVEMVTFKGRSMVKAHVTGIGGITGTTDGVVSTTADYSSFTVLGWRGIRVKNPYAATIMIENI